VGPRKEERLNLGSSDAPRSIVPIGGSEEEGFSPEERLSPARHHRERFSYRRPPPDAARDRNRPKPAWTLRAGPWKRTHFEKVTEERFAEPLRDAGAGREPSSASPLP